MILTQMALKDYEEARSRANRQRILSYILRRRNNLLSLDELTKCVQITNQHSLGIQVVPIEQIVGSLGRTRDFDNQFQPLGDHTQWRWISVMKAMYRDTALPPVELVKAGDSYFVVDGHHRISVARQREQLYIEAHVTEVELSAEKLCQLSVES
jgi:hypothetical protein